MVIRLYRCNDDRRKLNKTLTNGISMSECTITQPCDILHPEIVLDARIGADLPNWDALNKNYAYIGTFGRYYFISDYTIDTAARIHLQLDVDPLYSYASTIGNSYQHIVRSESVNSGKPTMITDSKYPVSPERDVKVILFEGGELGLSDATENTLCYILNVAGGAGS